MRTALFAAASLVAFSASAAASPFSLTTSSETDSATEQTKKESFVETVFNAAVGTFGFTHKAGASKSDDEITLRYYKKEEKCSAERSQTESSAEKEEEKAKTPSGPEPIYFGF